MQVLNPPVLDIDVRIAKIRGLDRPDLTAVGVLDRRVVWNLLHHLEAAGYVAFSVDNGDDAEAVNSHKEAMEIIFNLDDAAVFFRPVSVAAGDAGRRRWIRLVMGNSGWDVICDSSLPRGDEAWEKAVDSFNPEAFE